MAPFTPCYKPIVGLHETRILHLSPGRKDDPIRGRLEHVNIDDNPAYEALSYEWGSPEKVREILLEEDGANSSLYITQSLWHALLDLRPGQDANGSRKIWADGACINQENQGEREKQVSIMGLVYRSASRVITYIGPETDDSNLAIDFAYHLWRSCTAGSWDSSFPLDQIARARTLESEELPAKSDARCLALQKLLLRGWAARCWCAQEFMLNNKLWLMCGQREIKEWFLLPGIVQLVFNRSLPAFLLPSSSEDPNSLRECLVILLKSRNWLKNGGQFLLPQLLSSFHTLQVSDPRDKVYAILSLAHDNDALSEVDYSRPVESLYISVAASIVTRYQLLDLLYCNLGERSLALPSWVPDWSSWRFGTSGMLNDHFHSAGGLRLPEMNVVDGIDLEVAGFIFDRISQLSDQVGPRYTTECAAKDCVSLRNKEDEIDRGSSLSNFEWLSVQTDTIASLCQYPQGAASQIDVLWRTLTTNMSFYEELALPGYVAYFEAHMVDCLEDGAERETRHVPPTFASSSTTLQSDMAREFRDTVRRRMRYRRLCVTEKQYFGAVPQESLVGDLICLFEGGRSLFVVRDKQKEKGGYEFIGPAYIHGLMKGEIIEMDEYKREMIRLV